MSETRGRTTGGKLEYTLWKCTQTPRRNGLACQGRTAGGPGVYLAPRPLRHGENKFCASVSLWFRMRLFLFMRNSWSGQWICTG